MFYVGCISIRIAIEFAFTEMGLEGELNVSKTSGCVEVLAEGGQI